MTLTMARARGDGELDLEGSPMMATVCGHATCAAMLRGSMQRCILPCCMMCRASPVLTIVCSHRALIFGSVGSGDHSNASCDLHGLTYPLSTPKRTPRAYPCIVAARFASALQRTNGHS
jgi:hypothetical protein